MERIDETITFNLSDHRRYNGLPDSMNIDEALAFFDMLQKKQVEIGVLLHGLKEKGADAGSQTVAHEKARASTENLGGFVNDLTVLVSPELSDKLTPKMFVESFQESRS